jgi:hypothetical protein
MFGNTLLCGATIVSLHNILKLFNNEKSPPYFELKLKDFFHISKHKGARKPNVSTKQPSGISSMQKCKHNMSIFFIYG